MPGDRALLVKNTHSLFLEYLLPAISATLFISLNYIVDTICVGQELGAVGVTALGIAQPVCGVLFGLGALMGTGGSTLFSLYVGKGDRSAAKGVYTACFLLLAALLTLIGVLGSINMDTVVTLLGGTGEARQGVHQYLRYVFLFAPFYGLEMLLTAFLRNDRAPRLSMAATFIGSGLNIVLDILLVVVLKRGIPGASLATGVSIAAAVVFLLLCTLRKNSLMRPAFTKEGFTALPHALRIGLPSLVSECSASVTLLAFNHMLLRLSGENAVAVYSVMGNLTIIVVNALNGVSNAMQPIVSVNIGAGRFERARKVLHIALWYAVGIASLFIILGEVFPRPLVQIFVREEESFYKMAENVLRIVFLSYLPASGVILLGSYFQSVDEGGAALVVNTLRGLVLPVLLVVGMGTYLGLDGIWYSTIATEALSLCAAAVMLFFIQRKLRLRNYDQLKFITGKRGNSDLEEILSQLGAENLTSFNDLIAYANARDENVEGIPAYVCLEDLTTDYEGGYQPAEDDEDMGLFLAVGGLLFTDLYEQNAEFMKEKLKEADYPAAAPALNVLAEKCFRFLYDEETDNTTVIPFKTGIYDVTEEDADVDDDTDILEEKKDDEH